jgi:hypothetical protein
MPSRLWLSRIAADTGYGICDMYLQGYLSACLPGIAAVEITLRYLSVSVAHSCVDLFIRAHTWVVGCDFKAVRQARRMACLPNGDDLSWARRGLQEVAA